MIAWKWLFSSYKFAIGGGLFIARLTADAPWNMPLRCAYGTASASATGGSGTALVGDFYRSRFNELLHRGAGGSLGRDVTFCSRS